MWQPLFVVLYFYFNVKITFFEGIEYKDHKAAAYNSQEEHYKPCIGVVSCPGAQVEICCREVGKGFIPGKAVGVGIEVWYRSLVYSGKEGAST